jgi:adenine-specific DNA-methyltransferase
LNKVGEYWFTSHGKKRGVGVDIGVKVFRLFPIPKLIDKTEKSLHDEIVTNVEALLKLNEELKDAKLQTKITQLQSRIAHHEQRVNDLVYKLYDLTPEEIALVEAG